VVYVLKIYPRTHAKRLSSPGAQEDDIKIYHKKGSQKR
jgi:hypothetical protein